MQKIDHDYALAFEMNPLPMWVIDRETMGFVEVNEAALRQYGYSREEFLALGLRDIRPPEALPQLFQRWQQFLQQGKSGKPVSLGLLAHRRKDGSLITAEVTATALTYQGAAAILSVAVDVTDRVRAEEEARESRERFELALRAVKDTIWDWHIQTGKVWRSENVEGLFGTRREEIQPTFEGWSTRLHADDRERVVTSIRGAFARRERAWSGEYRLRRGDGSWADVMDRALVIYDAAGRPVRMIGSVVDMTDRKRVDQALLDQRRRLKAIFDNAQDAIFLTGDDGHFLDANPAACALFGYGLEELRAGAIWDLILKELEDEYRERLRILMRTGRQNGEGRGRRKDGTVAEVEYRTVANIESGVHLAVVRDISDRKRDEESLRRLSGELLRLQDEERRRIARELHDSTAQTLAAMSLELGVLDKEADALRPRARKALDEVHALVDNCSKELRTLSYLLHPPLLDEMGLAAALRGYVDGFSQRSGVQVDLEIPDDLGRLAGDLETTLFRVVQECLTNVHRHSSSPVARVRLALEPGSIVLEVADRGRGLPPHDSDEAGRDRLGLGVGIAGMTERMRLLGGRLDLESAPSGLTVRALLPLEPA